MGWRLAAPGDARETGFIKRFDARFWTVNFPRPMMAAVTTTGHDALRVDAVFYRADDLVGLIWAAEDRHDHPLLAYETARDFRDCTLRFRWRSGGVRALDGLNGPTLTIEGRDAGGNPRAWYVRLWNYAAGSPTDAVVTIDFAALDGGFLLPGEADPVWAGDIDRMFVSLVAPGYDASATMLAAPAEGWAEVSGIVCDGPGSVLAIGDAQVPAHSLRIATGYDDLYGRDPGADAAERDAARLSRDHQPLCRHEPLFSARRHAAACDDRRWRAERRLPRLARRLRGARQGAGI